MVNVGSATPTQVVMVPFAEMQQKQQVQAAIANENAPQDGKNKGPSDLDTMMPKWMSALGEANYNMQQSYGANGNVGKFLASMEALSQALQPIVAAIQSAGCFGGVKSFLDSIEKNPMFAAVGPLSTLVHALARAIDEFKTEGKSSQALSEKNSEYQIVSGEASAKGNEGQKAESLSQTLEQQNTIGSDGSTEGDVMEQISAGFAQG